MVDRSTDWHRHQVKRRLAELNAERRDLVARLLANAEDREAAEDELERIDRG